MNILQKNCKKTSQPVNNLNLVLSLIEDMTELCKGKLGIYPSALAIAHCQVDHENPKRFFVTYLSEVMVNPKILEKEQEFIHSEGCMSFAFRETKKIKRFKKIKVRYLNLL